MNILKRFTRMVRSYLNHWISKFEDHDKMLDQMVDDMDKQLIDAKRKVAVAISDERKLFNQYEKEKKEAESWEKKAIIAVKANRDDLAQQAIEKQTFHAKQASLFYSQWESQKNSVDNLKKLLNSLSEKVNEAKRKQNLLSARSKRAKAQQDITDTISGLSNTSAIDAFNKIDKKISDMEIIASTTSDVSRQLAGSDLDKQIEELENFEKEDLLQKLKNKINNKELKDINVENEIKKIEKEIKE